MRKRMRMILFILAVIQLITVIGILFYINGIKKYGIPSEFKQKQLELMQARRDSIQAVERRQFLPENIADSTMFGVGRHAEIFEEAKDSEKVLKTILSSLDSLEQGRKALEEKEKDINEKLNFLTEKSEMVEDENIKKLAQIYNNMKAPQAVPLFISMDDTTAVYVITLMNQRNASRLLGALVEADMEKATRINKLLAEIGK